MLIAHYQPPAWPRLTDNHARGLSAPVHEHRRSRCADHGSGVRRRDNGIGTWDAGLLCCRWQSGGKSAFEPWHRRVKYLIILNGWVAERLKAPVLKTGRGASSSWVRIPPHPPFSPQTVSLLPENSMPLTGPSGGAARRLRRVESSHLQLIDRGWRRPGAHVEPFPNSLGRSAVSMVHSALIGRLARQGSATMNCG